MILDPNSTVQPETTFMLSHKRAICDEVMYMCTLIQSWGQIFFYETEKFWPAELEQTLSRSGLNRKYDFTEYIATRKKDEKRQAIA